jgi:hypothetical protein
MGLRGGDLRVPAFALCTHVAYGFGPGGGFAARGVERRAPPSFVAVDTIGLRKAGCAGGDILRMTNVPAISDFNLANGSC